MAQAAQNGHPTRRESLGRHHQAKRSGTGPSAPVRAQTMGGQGQLDRYNQTYDKTTQPLLKEKATAGPTSSPKQSPGKANWQAPQPPQQQYFNDAGSGRKPNTATPPSPQHYQRGSWGGTSASHPQPRNNSQASGKGGGSMRQPPQQRSPGGQRYQQGKPSRSPTVPNIGRPDGGFQQANTGGQMSPGASNSAIVYTAAPGAAAQQLQVPPPLVAPLAPGSGAPDRWKRFRGRPSWFECALGFKEASGRPEDWETTRRQLASLVRQPPPGASPGGWGRGRRGRGPRIAGAAVGEWHFESLADLRNEANRVGVRNQSGGGGMCGAAHRLENIVGEAEALHAMQKNAGALFQVASQFNCLEFARPGQLPEEGVTCYDKDPTQGPACAKACAAATAFRNYLVQVPHQGSYHQGQTKDVQLNGLADLQNLLKTSPDAASPLTVKNGYTEAGKAELRAMCTRVQNLDEATKRKFRDVIRIGVHYDAQVTSDQAPEEHYVAQAFCSALSVGYSTCPLALLWAPIACIVLEAEYEACLWAAVVYHARCRPTEPAQTVFLTKLGGGVFRNNADWIRDAISRAHAAVGAAGFALDCRIVHYDNGPMERGYRAIEQGKGCCCIS